MVVYVDVGVVGPCAVVDLGTTDKTREQFLDHLATMEQKFTVETYHILQNNCNNFSHDVANYLVGKDIPSYITGLPNEVMSGPFGAILRPFIESMQQNIRDAAGQQRVDFGHQSTSQPTSTSANSTTANSPPTNIAKSLTSPVLNTSSSNRVKIVNKLNEFALEYKLPPIATPSAPVLDDVLVLCLKLPSSKVFPALDLLRLMIVDDVKSCARASALLNELLHAHVIGQPTHSRGTLLMALRCVQNCFAYEEGVQEILSKQIGNGSATAGVDDVLLMDHLFEVLETSFSVPHEDVRTTAAALSSNLAGTNIRFPKLSLTEEQCIRLTHILSEALQHSDNIANEQIYHQLLCALGGVVTADPGAREFAAALGVGIVDTGLVPETQLLAEEVRALISSA
ncbi:hypothetical protein SARC_06751 [Sphaeroforma arctica JP610]|uniref:PPPDE domain-containing protein n=1 Tax=Sphaeroforma arctica JP610 TaxID=667725 RepID=A0A0L0FVM9_9EUKA|nr:hypothetical protein SARC_06751 [Sphaeroforma arctica JP610]KNC80910.1 hypothetical protein SARC_06751 [Sphaeroforma arctica JP610]|eukprot:XP_014154812.1 hypothetical protein SARC_06751 [Sphaeroforma arctica JP610]